MTTVPPPVVEPEVARPTWGLGDAMGGWFLAQVCAATFMLWVLKPAFGYSTAQLNDNDVSLSFLALGYPPLWLGFVGVPIWAAATKGRGWIEDFWVRLQGIDLAIGPLCGVLAQYLLVPLVSLPVLWLTNTDIDKLGEPARELGAKANTPGGVVLMFLMVGLGAPIAEELFFRGLVLQSLAKRFGTGWAVLGSSIVFSATHFQALQFPALAAVGAVFALLVVRTGRLGPAILAHMAFNTATVVHLVWFT